MPWSTIVIGVSRLKGWGRGIAVSEFARSVVAQVVEAGIVNDEIVVRRVTCAVDCGQVINPMKWAQIESGIIYGLSMMTEKIEIVDGVVQQRNYDGFPILRMNRTPQIHAIILPSENKPTGIGEVALPPVNAAVSNAIYAATGVRLTRCPCRMLGMSMCPLSQVVQKRRMRCPNDQSQSVYSWRRGILSTVVLAEETTNQKPEEQEVSPEEVQQGISAFQDVYEVLQHPRCLNCHPSGDAPLQTDKSIPHAMNITRASTDAGLECATCHQTKNSEAYGVDGGPPGAPNWHLPEKEMPLIFEGRSVVELCLQLKDPVRNGHKTLDQLYLHVAHDPLVLWGGTLGIEQTALSHDKFARQFKTWVDAGAPCPTVSDSVEK